MEKTKDVLDRLSKRPDTEHTQALLRLGVVALGLLYVCWVNGFTFVGLDVAASTLQTTGLVSTAFSLGLVYHIIGYPRVSIARRFLGMAHDVVAVTVLFYYRPELASLLLFVYPFTAIGNGFRYGEKWLLISALMGSAGLAVLLGTSEYWANNSLISTGLAINFLTVVTYTGLLLRKLRSTAKKLEELATHDGLTGLPNRHLMARQLRDSLELNRKHRRTIGCIYFDLDGFKKVNDTLGHPAGDALLQEVGRRTRTVLREGDLLARLGGDEFSIILESIQTRADAERVCDRVIKAIEGIKTITGAPVQISASIGCVIIAPNRQRQPTDVVEESIMRQADECMYQSKQSGKGRYTIAEHAASAKAA